MIERDIRIGNIIMFDDGSKDVVRITGIFEQDESWFVDWVKISGEGSFESGNSLLESEFEPIAITPDFLLKNGFVKEGRRCDTAREDYHLGEHHDRDYIMLTCNSDDTRFWYGDIEIKYVHEYQNLYWFLTKKDVDIKF